MPSSLSGHCCEPGIWCVSCLHVMARMSLAACMSWLALFAAPGVGSLCCFYLGAVLEETCDHKACDALTHNTGAVSFGPIRILSANFTPISLVRFIKIHPSDD